MIKLKDKIDSNISEIKKNYSTDSLKQIYMSTVTNIKTDIASMEIALPIKDKSKDILKDISKEIFKASGIKESYKTRCEKNAREKAIETAKKKGIPLAPNGLAYDEEQLKTLMQKNKWTQERAIEEMKKDPKYTQEDIEAPNGTFYAENDIKYLMDRGYDREQAIEYLSKTSKYKKVTAEDIKAQNEAVIKKASRKFVDDQVDKILDIEVDKITAQYGIKTKWDEETKNKIRAIIRGEANVVFSNDKIIKNAVEQTEKELNNYFRNNLEKKVKNALEKGISVTEEAASYIQKFDISQMLLTEEDISKALSGSIEGKLNNIRNTVGLSDKAADLDKKLGKFGIELGLQDKMNNSLKKVSQNISEQLAKQLQPQLAKQAKITQSVVSQLANYQEHINEIEQKALARINEWKEEAKAKIKEQEEKIIKDALGSLTKNVSKIKFKF